MLLRKRPTTAEPSERERAVFSESERAIAWWYGLTPCDKNQILYQDGLSTTTLTTAHVLWLWRKYANVTF